MLYVGAGTGSVSVEIARVLRGGTVYAVERNPEAIRLLEQNRMRFELDNLKIVEGLAPGALKDLPTPQGVFIGGSSGGISPIIRLAVDKNPWVRLVINAITLETVGAPKSEILYMSVNPNGEAEVLKIYFKPRPRLKKVIVDRCV